MTCYVPDLPLWPYLTQPHFLPFSPPIPALQRLDACKSRPQRNVLGTPSLLLPDLISSRIPYLCDNTVSFGFREGITFE